MTTLAATTSAEAAESSAAASTSLAAEVITAPESRVASAVPGPMSESESSEILAISRQIRRALECPICLTLMSAMSCFCPNGHAVCQSCMLTLLNINDTNDTRCPLCRTSMVHSASMSAMVVKLAEASLLVKVACSNWPYGCTEMVPVRNANEHESGCRYVPDVQCQVFVCQWVGMYEQLYEHVCNVHPGVAVQTSTNRLNVAGVHEITSKRRRTYLVRSSYGMMWVLLSRASRSRIQAGLFLVKDTRGSRTPAPEDDSTADSSSPNIMYRITWFDSNDRSRTRCRTREVNWTTTQKEGGHTVTSGAYTMFRSRASRMEINWFRYTRYNNSQVRNNNSTA